VIVCVEACEDCEVDDCRNSFLSKEEQDLEQVRVLLKLLCDLQDFNDLPYHLSFVFDVTRPRPRFLELFILLLVQNLRNSVGAKKSSSSFRIVNLLLFVANVLLG